MNGLLAILGAAIFFGGFAGALRIASQKNRSWGEVFFYFPIASGLLLIVLTLSTLFIAHVQPGVSRKFIWLSSYLGASILGLLLLHQ